MKQRLGILLLALGLWAAATRAGDLPLVNGDNFSLPGNSLSLPPTGLSFDYVGCYLILHNPTLQLYFSNPSRSGVGITAMFTNSALGFQIYPEQVYPFQPKYVMEKLGSAGGFTQTAYQSNLTVFHDDYVVGMNNAQLIIVGITAAPFDGGAFVQGLTVENADRATALSYTPNLLYTTNWSAESNAFGNSVNWPALSFDYPNSNDHPSKAGNIGDAYFTITQLGWDTNVSSATFDARHASLSASNHCVVSSVTGNDHGLTIIRKEDRLPWAIDEAGRFDATNIWHQIMGWQNYLLTITNLAAGNYNVFIDGTYVAAVSDVTLSNGWNMADLTLGPIHDQCQKVLADFRAIMDIDPVGLTNLNTTKGESQYRAACITAYETHGLRGAALIADAGVQAALTSLTNLAVTAHNDAQPSNHTFSIVFVNPASTSIGAESLVPLPSSANLRLFAGDAPDDGSVQVLNPPVFSWVYDQEYFQLPIENSVDYGTNIQPKVFQLQLATNAAFSPMQWSITTSNNYYNYLAPITNADGSKWAGTDYWRVVYMGSNQVIQSTGQVHYFTLASTAGNWNRSMLADTNYLYGIATNHPHLFFNLSNRDAVSAYARTTTVLGWNWLTQSNAAATNTTRTWWNASTFLTQTNDPLTNDFQIAETAFFGQMTTNLVWLTNCANMINMSASNYCTLGYTNAENYNLNDDPKWLALVYDWTYPYMTSAQRSNVLFTMETLSHFWVYQDWWYTDTNAFLVKKHSEAKTGSSHPSVTSGAGFFLTAAGMGESQKLLSDQSFYLNTLIAIGGDPFHLDEGRSYDENNFRVFHNLAGNILANTLFPEATLTNTPWLNATAERFAYQEPFGYRENTDQFGDYTLPFIQWFYDKYYAIGVMTGNGNIIRQYNRSLAVRDATAEFLPIMGDLFLGYYYPNVPAESDWPNTFYTNMVDGFVFSGSVPPDDYGAFTNSVGIAFSARPSGSRTEHGGFHDGTLQMWAFGAQVTVGGVFYYWKNPIWSEGLFVDGIGEQNPINDPCESNYCQITAFTNTSDFTFIQGDLTKAYNRLPFTLVGGQDVLGDVYYATNKRPYLSSLQRNVLFAHKKYVVLYDTFQTSTNAHFQWKWNVAQPGMVIDTNAGSFHYQSTNFYNGSNVMTYVQHVTDPAKLSWTVLSGTNNALVNPVTGEDYNAIFQSTDPTSKLFLWTNSIWVQNATATNNWHFLTVIYPVKWGGTAPTITALDDYTVVVNDNLGTVDTNTFGTSFAGPSTFRVNAAQPSVVHLFAPWRR